MTDTAQNSADEIDLRPLTAKDLDAVVAIDATLSGRQRRGFYQRRLHAALQDPKGFVYLGACVDGRLAGFVLARILGGEFGETSRLASLDAIGVDPGLQTKGCGRALMAGLDEILRHKGIQELRTQTTWTNHSLLSFFEAARFEIAPRIVLERGLDAPPPH